MDSSHIADNDMILIVAYLQILSSLHFFLKYAIASALYSMQCCMIVWLWTIILSQEPIY